MAEEKKSFFARLREGLTKTRNNIVKGFDSVFFGYSVIDDEFYEELEETMIMGDLGGRATEEILDRLKEQVNDQGICDPQDCREILIDSIREQMHVGKTAYDFEKEQSVVMVIGVNGVGKTTSIGKLASKLKKQGRKVLIAAADTFRAAAGDQLEEWANRAGVDMNRIIDREFPGVHRENLVVLDGTTGQNALVQAREFAQVMDLTGIILTKMDGTAKGGIAVAIQSELHVPVKYIGVGEKIEDLQKFDPDQFVNALFDTEKDEVY